MPTTLIGLTFFVSLVVPGLLYNAQRRTRIPLRASSALVEAGTLATVSLVTNAIALALFGVLRIGFADNTPEPRRIVREGVTYASPRLSYLGLWAAFLLAVSCALAYAWGRGPRWVRQATARFTPTIVDVPAWYQVFEDAPDDHLVFVGCDMRDGAYVSGYLDWYSTEVEETADRDLALAAPITLKRGSEPEELGVERVLVSARDLLRIFVAYVPAGDPSPGEMVTR